jgi:hypothetical protein
MIHCLAGDDTHKEFIDTMRDLPFRARDSYIVARLFCTREDNLAVPFLLQFFELT